MIDGQAHEYFDQTTLSHLINFVMRIKVIGIKSRDPRFCCFWDFEKCRKNEALPEKTHAYGKRTGFSKYPAIISYQYIQSPWYQTDFLCFSFWYFFISGVSQARYKFIFCSFRLHIENVFLSHFTDCLWSIKNSSVFHPPFLDSIGK